MHGRNSPELPSTNPHQTRAHLQRVVGGQGAGEPPREEHREGVAVVVKEERVVGQWGHAQPDLAQVEEVLRGQGGGFRV